MYPWFRFQCDSCRAKIMGGKRAGDDVIFHVGSKLFVILWNTKSMGRIVWAEQNIEKTVELPFPDEADVANCHGRGSTAWTGLPKCVPVGRIFDCKVVPKNVVVGHCGGTEVEDNPRKTLISSAR